MTSAGGLDVRAPTPGSESAFGVGALGADGAAGGLDSVRYEAAGNSRFAFRGGLLAAAVAAALGVIALLTGVSGGDIAAAVYRVDLFRRVGFTLWDNGWYAGHWTLDYSVLFAPIGATLGIPLTDVACAAIAAWAFDRLMAPRFGRVGHVAAAVFAAGTLVQIASGRVPFLLGEAIALLALLAAARRSWPLALLLAIVASMCSPLAETFLALAALAWLLADLPRWNLGSGALGCGRVDPGGGARVALSRPRDYAVLDPRLRRDARSRLHARPAARRVGANPADRCRRLRCRRARLLSSAERDRRQRHATGDQRWAQSDVVRAPSAHGGRSLVAEGPGAGVGCACAVCARRGFARPQRVVAGSRRASWGRATPRAQRRISPRCWDT